MYRLKIARFVIEYLKKRSTFKTTFKQDMGESVDEKIYEGKYEEIKSEDKKKKQIFVKR